MIFTAETIKMLRENLEGEIKCYNYNDCTVIEFEDPDEALNTMYIVCTELYNSSEPMRVTIEMSSERYAIIEEFDFDEE